MFLRVDTQWRVGQNGATGLDYNPLFVLMDRRNLSGEEWDSMLSDIRILESAAIDTMRKNKASQAA